MTTRVQPARSLSSSDHDHATTTEKSVHPSVDEAERAFVQGSFKRALELANTFLSTEQQTTRTIRKGRLDNRRISQLDTRLCLSIDEDQNDRCIRIDWDKEDCCVARAAAISLQSWYELASSPAAQRNHHHRPSTSRRATRHLLPFLNHCCTTTYEMSRELLVVLIRFCHATSHFGLAIELASESIHCYLQSQIKRNDESSFPTESDSIMGESILELAQMLLIELLPYCQDAAAVEAERLLHIRDEGWKPCRKSNEWIPSREPQAEALDILLSSIGPDSYDWLGKTLVQECRGRWEAMVRDLVEVSSSDDGDNQLRAPREQSTSLVPNAQSPISRLGLDRGRRKLFLRLRQQLRMSRLLSFLRGIPETIRRDPDKRNQVAFTILSLWIAWKHRRRLLAMSSSVFRSTLWTPAKEIVEALLVPRN